MAGMLIVKVVYTFEYRRREKANLFSFEVDAVPEIGYDVAWLHPDESIIRMPIADILRDAFQEDVYSALVKEYVREASQSNPDDL